MQNTSAAQDMDHPPTEQGLPISRFANIHISISDMKNQAKPGAKKSQMGGSAEVTVYYLHLYCKDATPLDYQGRVSECSRRLEVEGCVCLCL